MLPVLFLSGLLGLTPTAAARKPAVDPQAAALAAVDDAMVQAIARAQASAQAAPGDVRWVYGWAGALTGAAQARTLGRGRVDAAALDTFFTAAANAASDPTVGGEVLGMAAAIALAAGRPAQALSFAEQALRTKPTNAALSTLLQLSTDPAAQTQGCTATLKAAASDIQRYDTLTACDAVLGSGWAPVADQSWYAAETRRRADSQAAHTQQLQAQTEAQAAAMAASAPRPAPPSSSSSASSASGSTSAAPSTVSVSLKVTCGERVRMFQGASPTSGGTYGWESPSSVRSLSVRPGSVICIANERDQVQSCWTASGERVSLELGCGGFLQR